MEKEFVNLWKGMLLVVLLVVYMPQVVCATGTDAGEYGGDVTTGGIYYNGTTTPSVKTYYKAGDGTITWTPAVKGSNGNVTSPAVLTLNNATITEAGIRVAATGDITVEVTGTNKISGNAIYGAMYFENSSGNLNVIFTGGGTLEADNVNDTYDAIRVCGNMNVQNVTITTPRAEGDCYGNGIMVWSGMVVDNGFITSSSIEMAYDGTLYLKSGVVNTDSVYLYQTGGLQVDKGATMNASLVGVVSTSQVQNSGTLNAVLCIGEGEAVVYGDFVFDERWVKTLEAYAAVDSDMSITFEISEGATLTVPEGMTIDASKVHFVFDSNSTLVVEGTLILSTDTTAAEIAKMNLTGDGVVIVAGADNTTADTVYLTEGTKLNVVSSLDCTNLGSGQTPATGTGYTWDATTKTLTLTNAYISGFLNLPAGSKIVVNGTSIVMEDVKVAGKVSDAFTLSGEGSLASADGKKYVSHAYGEPKFTWTETEDGYTAKATFTCQGGEDTQTVDATVTAGAYSTDGKVTYEAKVTFNGKAYTESKTAAIPVSKLQGVKIEDAKSNAVYKVTSATATGGTVEYVKHTSKTVKSVTIPKSITINGLAYKVTSVAAKAFKDKGKLTTVKIGDNVETIGKEAFSGCKKLKTVKLGKNIKTIGDKAFYKCTVLTSIMIPSKVTKIGKEAFRNCKKLKTITIKTKNLKSSKVGENAFKGIKSTATIKVPKAKLKTYKSMLKKKGVGKKAAFKKM